MRGRGKVLRFLGKPKNIKLEVSETRFVNGTRIIKILYKNLVLVFNLVLVYNLLLGKLVH